MTRKMLSKILILGAASLMFRLSTLAQSPPRKTMTRAIDKKETSAFVLTAFPELNFTSIAGAPKLFKPQLVQGTERPVVALGRGVGTPAIFDWDGDGIKDLLVGEFNSGVEKEFTVGNFIRVFKNEGTNEEPKFSGNSDYARFPDDQFNHGTPYSIYQVCCMSFMPQFLDLDGDEKKDMVSGNYYGEITFFKGAKEKFAEGIPIRQSKDPRYRGQGWLDMQNYWLYSSVSFGDMDGDGLQDAVFGGTILLTWAKNTGTATAPAFGDRDTLRDLNGKPLKVYDWTEEEQKANEIYEKAFGPSWALPIGGDGKLSPTVVDWDNDGVLDMLVTNSYMHKGLNAIDFFKGVKTGEGLRFQKPVSLFTEKNGGKSFPGATPRLTVCDYNNDGVWDLLIGASIETVREKPSQRLMWEWENDNYIHGPGKAPGFMNLTGKALEDHKNSLVRKKQVAPGMTVDDFITIKHVGVVYVMLGRKE